MDFQTEEMINTRRIEEYNHTDFYDAYDIIDEFIGDDLNHVIFGYGQDRYVNYSFEAALRLFSVNLKYERWFDR